VYLALLVAAVVMTFLYELRTNGIFSCSAAGYSADSYLAYCNSTAYGDYDHGAFWFDLEPELDGKPAEAAVLFLGSSRMQFAFSSAATDEWFAAKGLSYYLLGFAYTENIVFTAPLLAQISPNAKAFIINSDGFFDDRVTPPVMEIFHDEAVESRYNRKRLWQYPHRFVCGLVPALCGNAQAFFRARDDGSWTFSGSDSLVHGQVMDAEIKDSELVSRRVAFAEEFVSRLPVARRCVFLTVVPWSETPRAEANAIADGLGVKLLAPRVDNLQTFDGSHLDDASAELWSQKFFEVAAGEIERCVAESGDESVQNSAATEIPGSL
jgi:hypothetical protein